MNIDDRAIELKDIILQCIDDVNHADMLQVNELCFAWATLEFMNEKIKKVNGLLSDKTFMASREKMSGEIQKYSSSLGLNRAQRMKMATKLAEPVSDDPLLRLLEN